jgi:hypothetical protein
MVNLTWGLGRFITISVFPLEIAPIVGVHCIASVCTNQNPVNAMKFRKSTLFKIHFASCQRINSLLW